MFGQPRELDQALVSTRLPWRGGAAGVSYVRSVRYDDRARVVSLSLSQDFGRVSLFATAFRDVEQRGSTGVFLGLSVPLARAVNATAGVSQSRGDLAAYVEAARVTGSGHARILFTHIAPNVLPLSFLFASIAIGWAILIEASVSFLGFGDPDAVSWGFMLQDAYASQALSRQMYNWFVPPGICIILVVSAGFFLSRSYEQFLFPKLRG